MEKYLVNIKDGNKGTYPIEHHNAVSISREQYTELLLNLGEVTSIEELLKQRLFSCGKCRSFSLAAFPLYSALAKIDQNDLVAEIITPCLKERTDIHSIYFELLGKPDEIIEKYLDKDDDFYEIQHELQTGNYVIEDGEVFRYPFEECVFVFDENCTCRQIMIS